MIIGNGLLAGLFKNWESSNSITIFASGVSNSKETRKESFDREKNLLLQSVKADSQLVYFSTTSIDDPFLVESPYVLHKIEMENIVKEYSQSYQIFRLSQVLGSGGNANTLINFLAQRIKSGQSIDIHADATRNIVTVKDVKEIAELFIKSADYHNRTINIATPWDVKIPLIVELLESYYGRNAEKYFNHKGHLLKTKIKEIQESGYEFKPNNYKEYLLNAFAYYLGE